MTPQELKNSILQLAIQGRLVEQRPEEGTAEELYKQIQTEKQALIKTGKLKKEKPLPEITEDEKPFDIPESWMWCYIGEIFQHNTGKALNGSDNSGTQMTYITTSNLYWNRFELDKLKSMPFTEAEEQKCTVQKGDLLVCEGGEYGRSAIWSYDEPIRIQNHIHRLKPYKRVSVQYFYYCFFLYKHAGMISGKGIGIQGLSSNALHSMIMPLPPLAEQERIVARMEELLPLIDRYEQAWNRLEDLNKRFPGDLQKSILQLAIQGKLVPQRPEEGTGEELYQQIQAEKQALSKAGKLKKEKLLPEITEAEIPFEIPESWKWVRLGSISDKLTDGSHNPPPNTGVGYPVISAKNVKNGLISFENVERYADEAGFNKENPRTNITYGDIIMGIIGGSIGNVGVYLHREKVIAQRSIAIIHVLIDAAYLISILRCPYIQTYMHAVAAGSAQGGVYLGTLSNLLIPLPPLAEQRRIVAKLEELSPLCERLK